VTAKLLCSIISTGILTFCGIIIETAMNITFPTLMKEFSVSTATVQWMTTSYLLIVAIIVPLSSFLKRRFSKKTLFVAADLIFIIGVLCDLFAPNFTMLLLGRFIQGIGTGIAMPLMFNIILEEAPLDKIGTLMGVGSLLTAVGPALGPTYGGWISSVWSWRMIFVTLLPFLIAALFVGSWAIKKSETEKVRFDVCGEILLALTFVSLILGLNSLGKSGTIDLTSGSELVFGAAMLAAFVRHSKMKNAALVDLSVFKNGSFSCHVFAFFVMNVCSLSLAFVFPNYLQIALHHDAFYSSLMTLPAAILGAFCAPFSGRMFDRYGAKKPLVIGGLLDILGLLLLTVFAHGNLTAYQVMFFYCFYMFGMGLSFSTIMTDGLTLLDKRRQTDGNAVFNTFQQFSGAVGTALGSTLMAIAQKGSGSLAESTGLGTFWIFLVLTILMIAAEAILLPHVRGKEKA
jgi:DHA2 family lincomycin resistance protein-like MFS transporter